MASIKRREGGKWQAQVRRTGHTARTKTFLKKSDAEAWVRKLESEIDTGSFLPSREAERTTLGTCLERYRKTVTPTKRGHDREASKLACLERHPLAKRFMASIRGSDLAAYRDERLGDGVRASTFVRELAVLSHVFTVARKEWGMDSLQNPAALVTKPKISDGRERLVLTAAMSLDGAACRSVDEITVIKHFSGSIVLPIVLDIAIDTAMRRGEIASLRWEHIHQSDGYISIPRTHTKNGKGREVPVSDSVLDSLNKLPNRTRLGAVFAMRSDGMTLAFHRALVRARAAYEDQNLESLSGDPFLVDLRFHDLRHEATTRLATIYDAHELAKVTGHSRMDLILRYYHPKGKDLAKKRRDAVRTLTVPLESEVLAAQVMARTTDNLAL